MKDLLEIEDNKFKDRVFRMLDIQSEMIDDATNSDIIRENFKFVQIKTQQYNHRESKQTVI